MTHTASRSRRVSRGRPHFLEDAQHRLVIGQDVRDQLPEACATADGDQVAHESGTNPLALVVVDESESDFRYMGAHDKIPAATNNRRLASLIRHGDQRNLFVTKSTSVKWATSLSEKCRFTVKKRKANGCVADAAERCHQSGAITRPPGSNLDGGAVAQRLDRRVIGCFSASGFLCGDVS